MNGRTPRPRSPAPAAERVELVLVEIGNEKALEDLGEVVNALTWLTEEYNRLKRLLLAADIDPDAEEPG